MEYLLSFCGLAFVQVYVILFLSGSYVSKSARGCAELVTLPGIAFNRHPVSVIFPKS
jgi:hypothetical protein